MEFELLQVPERILGNLNLLYTFFLLFTRFAAFIMLCPGIGMGERGTLVRVPAIFAFALASMAASPAAMLPADWGEFIIGVSSEFLYGAALGAVPLLVVSGVQMGAQIASSSMGLGASQLIDPTLGVPVQDLARITGDLTILFFLLLGGHHVVFQAVAGLDTTGLPGTFHADHLTVSLLVDRCADIFRVGVMVSAPVVVALLLTQFVMGIISRAVPTVNIFIISFPLTIGIGMVLSVIAMPDVMTFVSREIAGIENSVEVLKSDQKGPGSAAPALSAPPPVRALTP